MDFFLYLTDKYMLMKKLVLLLSIFVQQLVEVQQIND